MHTGMETVDGRPVDPKHIKWIPGVLEPEFCQRLSDGIMRLAEKALYNRGDATQEEMDAVMRQGGEWMAKTSFLPYHALNVVKVDTAAAELPGDVIEAGVQAAVFPQMNQVNTYERTLHAGCFLAFPQREFRWHTDGQFDGFLKDGYTVWISLSDCGEDRPSLSAVDASDDAIRDYMLVAARQNGVELEMGDDIRATFDSHLTQKSVPHVYANCMMQDKLLSHFGAENILNVKAKAGDCVLMSNWTPHATYVPPNLRYPHRIAAVYRYSSK